MSDLETMIVAHKTNRPPKKAFQDWNDARTWRDEITFNPSDWTLTEVVVEELPEGIDT